MYWIKNAIVDIIVTITIIIAAIAHVEWLEYVVTGYTIVLLLAKIIIISMNQMQTLMKGRITDVPEWASHMLYATNVIVLAIFNWPVTAALWLVIWLMSYLNYKRVRAKKTPAKA
ncbi:MAG: hypothetical protein LC662_02245 [Rhodothermaceae bacterium]|nr:hypothetical protein [Rhodothermaceae bacterium]